MKSDEWPECGRMNDNTRSNGRHRGRKNSSQTDGNCERASGLEEVGRQSCGGHWRTMLRSSGILLPFLSTVADDRILFVMLLPTALTRLLSPLPPPPPPLAFVL